MPPTVTCFTKTQKWQSLIEEETWKRVDTTEMAVSERGRGTCTSIYMYGALTHYENRSVHQKQEDCTAVTTLQESKDLHCDPLVQEEKHIYLLFLLLVFSKNLTFLLVIAGTPGQEEARRGERKMALITGKRGR